MVYPEWTISTLKFKIENSNYIFDSLYTDKLIINNNGRFVINKIPLYKKKEDFAIDGISGMRAIESRFDMDGNLKYYYDHIWHKFNKYEYIQYKKEGIHTHSDKYDCFKRDIKTGDYVDGYRLFPSDIISKPDRFDLMVDENILETNVSVKSNHKGKIIYKYWPYLDNQIPFKVFYKWVKKSNNITKSLNIKNDWDIDKNVEYILLDNKRFITYK